MKIEGQGSTQGRQVCVPLVPEFVCLFISHPIVSFHSSLANELMLYTVLLTHIQYTDRPVHPGLNVNNIFVYLMIRHCKQDERKHVHCSPPGFTSLGNITEIEIQVDLSEEANQHLII